MHRLSTVQGGQLVTKAHYLIFLEATGGRVRAIDPFDTSKILDVSAQQFRSTWTGETLLVADSRAKLPEDDRWFRLLVLADLVIVAVVALAAVAGKPRARVATLLLLVSGPAGAGCGRDALGPALAFEHTRNDIGVRLPDTMTQYEHEFPFVNRSRRAVRIKKVDTGCFGTKVDYPDAPIPPGGRGIVRLKVDFRSTRPIARYEAYAIVRLDDRWNCSYRLSSFSYTLGSVEVEPNELEFGDLPAGSPVSREFTVRVPLLPTAEAIPPPEIRLSPGPFEVAPVRDTIEETTIHPRAPGSRSAMPCSC